ncbi:hypothetical protein ACCS88_21010 [Rhizobium ruizarguesonis]
MVTRRDVLRGLGVGALVTAASDTKASVNGTVNTLTPPSLGPFSPDPNGQDCETVFPRSIIHVDDLPLEPDYIVGAQHCGISVTNPDGSANGWTSFQLTEPERIIDEPKAPLDDADTRALREAGALPPLARPTPVLLERYKRIESGFSFEPLAISDHYIPLHVEPLLDQSADLLDRAIRDRASWDDLSGKWLQSVLTLKEEVAAEQVTARDIDAGALDVAWHQAVGDYRSMHRAIKALDVTTKSLAQADQNDDNYVYARGAIAFISTLLPVPNGSTPFQPNIDGTVRTIWDHMDYYTEKTTNYELKKANFLNFGQEYGYRAQLNGYLERVTAVKADAVYRVKEAEFDRQKFLIKRNFRDMKCLATFSPDGALNYGKRLDASKERFRLDLKTALEKIHAILPGLRDIYGYNEPIPKNYSDLDYFDDVLIWARKTIQWLLRFSRIDQNSAVSISLREQVGEQNWPTAIENGSFEFELPSELFHNMFHVRLRGISAYVEHNIEPKFWIKMSVKPPEKTEVLFLDGSKSVFDQSFLPNILIGRALSRFGARDADVFGVSILHNASPIGSWKAEIIGRQPASADKTQIQDIFLDLLVAYRGEKT